MNRIPVVLDCDTGCDDAMAILTGLACPEMDIRAITTVAGNVELKYTSVNTLNLVDVLGYEVPVAVGKDAPLFCPLTTAKEVHGEKGMGPVELPVSIRDFDSESAIDVIYREAKKAAGELHLVAVGPLTNIAHLFMTYPDVKPLIKHLTIMGGAIDGGNVTPCAEFNIHVDPEAARIVSESGVPQTWVTLDATMQATIDGAMIEELRGIETKKAKLAVELLDFMIDRNKRFHVEGAVMHDGLALASVAMPSLLIGDEYFLTVETKGEFTSGKTVVDVARVTGKPNNAFVTTGMNVEKFRIWMKAMIVNEA
jgi:pyrimidine-specific ribonucleoside hydrolase